MMVNKIYAVKVIPYRSYQFRPTEIDMMNENLSSFKAKTVFYTLIIICYVRNVTIPRNLRCKTVVLQTLKKTKRFENGLGDFGLTKATMRLAYIYKLYKLMENDIHIS